MSTRSPIADLRHGLDSISRPRIPPPVSDVLRRPGQPLDVESRTLFEPRFKHDFSKVRVHADAHAAALARALDALAYTVGNDVVFDAGQYAPRTGPGTRLLAHELTHVVQQRGASRPAGELDLDVDRAAEAEAQAVADDVARSPRATSPVAVTASAEHAGRGNPRLRSFPASRRATIRRAARHRW